MYADWSSLTIQLQSLGSATQSVLSKLPQDDGKQVVASVVKTVASHLGITVPSDAKPSTLNTEQEVNWCMEVICHGLCLPLTEHEVIRDSVNIYCEWLSALLPNPKVCVPKPVQEDPNFYAQKIITQLNHLFIPRKGEAQDTIHRQAVVCHRVLRRVQELAHQSQIMERGTWDALLSFLLAINDALLSPPAVKDDIGDQLCERVLGVLFEIWLIACVKSFPGPTLWKTLREMCMNWRHRAGLVTQWNRVNLTLTSRLIAFLYGPRFPVLNIPKEDMDLVSAEMTHECVAQSWYRFLNCLGNPVELSKPVSVSDTQQFKEYALKSFGVIDPTYHPCLVSLPAIFLRAMKGVSAIVDAYLGVYNSLHLEQDIPEPEPVSALLNNPLIPTPPASRKNIILGLAAQAHSHMSSIPSRAQNRSLKDSIIKTPIMRERSDVGKTQSVIGRPTAKDSALEKTALGRAISVDGNALPILEGLPRAGQIMSMSRSSSATSAAASTTSSTSMNVSTQSIVNSTAVLAAVTGTLSDQHNLTPSPLRPSCNSILHLFGLWLFEAAFIGTDSAKTGGSKKEQTGSSRPSSLSKGNTTMTSEPVDLPPGLTPDKFESGRAEALGALCRVFCSKRTGEEILPVYLARFYLAVQNGLTVGHDKVVSESLASILLNSSNLLRIDLDGVNVLAPSIVSALEAVLPEKEVKLTASYVNKADLRRAAIHLLQSMLTLPLHFANMQIKELLPTGERPAVNNFNQLKPRLVNLLINALQVEVEAVNTQMLLGCLLMTVQDAAALEEAELRQNDGFSDNSARNSAGVFQAAASDSVSMMSDFTSISGDRHSLQEHTLDASYADNVTDSAHALFVRATYLVCHRLISSWKSDLATSLAALELLRGLARINIPEQDALECKRAVKWLCDYIVTQCSRPPQAHSKDLHSSIVAAFQVCATWLVHHPYLLGDKECLASVVEVAELGISGSKSHQKSSNPPVVKEEKALNPVSKRVKDAAENFLSVVMEQVGYFPSLSGSESLSSLLDESTLLLQSSSWGGEQVTNQTAVQAFRYFVIDQTVVLGVLEESLGNSQDPQPTVTAIIRCPSNKAVWTLQLRHLPRHKSGQVQRTANPGRPLAMSDQGTRKDFKPCFFPDSIDRIPLCAADRSIPAVESIAGDENTAQELDRLSRLMEQQSILEKELTHRIEEEDSYSVEFESTPPEPTSEFQTARLILSHLGFLSIPALRGALDSPIPRLVSLENDTPQFSMDLENLDKLSPRTFDTMYAYYVRSGQSQSEDILSNSLAGDLNPLYLEMLAAIGWSASVASHPGWTGDLGTSWCILEEPAPLDQGPGPVRFDGSRGLLYWADVSSELALLVPSGSPVDSRPCSAQGSSFLAQDNISTHSSTSSYGKSERDEGDASLSLDLERDGFSRRKVGRAQNVPEMRNRTSSDHKVAVVWVESLEDALLFPGSELGVFCLVIFVHPLSTGLLRIKLAGQGGRMSTAIPLVDGMVVSRRALGPLIRQTALNMCRRRRLDQDSYQPPHVRRKLKIQELVQKYRSHVSEPEFFAHLFTTPSV